LALLDDRGNHVFCDQLVSRYVLDSICTGNDGLPVGDEIGSVRHGSFIPGMTVLNQLDLAF
jgi:hypothetical protein